MVTKTATKEATAKPKAQRLPISRLLVLSAYGKTFSTGKGGFFGQVEDPDTGYRYQIIGAVRIGDKKS